MKSRVVASAVASVCAASSAWAGLVNPLVPSWRNAPNTMFMGWESFTSAYAGPNAADMAGSSTLASLFNFAPTSTLTGSGNIYSGFGSLAVMIMGGVTSAPRNPTQVVLNIATSGAGAINDASVALTLFDNSGNSRRLTPSTTEVRSSAASSGGGFPGNDITVAYSWTVPDLVWNCTRWQVDFGSTGIHTSLDAVSLDMNLVPGPGALSVLAALLPGATRGRRRRC